MFSQLFQLGISEGVDISFVQIAETDSDRAVLGGIDLSYHNYPFRLLFRGNYGSLSLRQLIVALGKDLITHPCDLVVLPNYDRAEYWAMLLLCILLRRRRAVICDATTHDQPKIAWREIAKRFFFARCDGFFSYGTRSKEYLMSYGVDGARIHIRRQAAALPHDYDSANVLSAYKSQNIETLNSPRYLYVGRLSGEKGLGDLLNAFNLIHARIPGALLDLIGAGSLSGWLAERISNLGLQKAVTLRGSLTLREIEPQLLCSVALVLPSHSEPWGLVVNESLSYGCPVVVSSHCGCAPELVIDGVSGYVFECGNVEALSTTMLAVARLSEDRVATAKSCMEIIAPYTADRAALQMLDGCLRILKVRA